MHVLVHQKGVYVAANYRKITRYGNINYFSLHAEIHAILKYLKVYYKTSSLKQKSNQKNNSTIYIVRTLKDKKNIPENQTVVFGNCMPCTNCQKYLAKFGFKKIKYTDYINNENVLHELKLIQ